MDVNCLKEWGGFLHVRLWRTLGNKSQCARIEWDDVEEGAYAGPTFQMKAGEAQVLMDDLWNCGIRPSEGAGSAGSLAATERHLKDMQSIAKGLLKAKGIDV